MRYCKDQTVESQRDNKQPAEYETRLILSVEETKHLERGIPIIQTLTDGRQVEVRIVTPVTST